MGVATPADYAASGFTNYATGGYGAGYATTGFGQGYSAGYGAGYGATGYGYPYGQATGYDASGGGFVGGSWSPEPAGNNQIIYGLYSSPGALASSQANFGQAAVYNPQTFQTAQPAAATTAATTTEGGGQTATPAATPAAADPAKTAAEKKAAADKKAAAEKKAAAADDKPAPAPEKKVTVKAGDSLSEIAAKNGTTWQKLYEANKGVIGGNPNLIKPGQELKIP